MIWQQLFLKGCLTAGFLCIATASCFAQENIQSPAVAKPEEMKAPQIEVCFVLDTTGSMSGLIQGAKDKIWSIANELIATKPAPKIKFGLIGYRDRSDVYITQISDLTEDIDAIYTKLTAFEADGGGDQPESVNQALHESVSRMSWSSNSDVLKVVFLVGDAPPHMDYENEIRYPEVCKAAMERRLFINTVLCGGDPATEKIWREIASLAEGKFVAIPQSGGAVAIATPFDEEIARCNSNLNSTVCAYGDEEAQSLVVDKLKSNVASGQEAIANRAQYNSYQRNNFGTKFSGKVVGGDDDLVELLMGGTLKATEIDAKKLPADLAKLSPEELNRELQKRIDARKKLQEEIDTLLKKRAEFVAAERKKLAAEAKTDSFDENVKKIIREQAALRGIDYSKN
ncbi:MAG: VWA domain-containing protein [Planctomycetota bacterium]